MQTCYNYQNVTNKIQNMTHRIFYEYHFYITVLTFFVQLNQFIIVHNINMNNSLALYYLQPFTDLKNLISVASIVIM